MKYQCASCLRTQKKMDQAWRLYHAEQLSVDKIAKRLRKSPRMVYHYLQMWKKQEALRVANWYQK